MNHKKRKRGVLLKMGISRDTLLAEFISGMSLSEIGKKYKRTNERIWQIIRKGIDKHMYARYVVQHKKNRKDGKLSAFMSYAKELGRVPRLEEVITHYRGIQTYYYEFRKVAAESGLVYIAAPDKRGRPRKHGSDQLLAYLRELAVRLGRTPSCNDINREGIFTHNMYITCFDTLKHAQAMAGLSPNKKYNSLENARRSKRYVTKEHCLEDVKRLHIELGSPPSLTQLKEHGKYSFNKYYSRLGGIKRIRKLLQASS